MENEQWLTVTQLKERGLGCKRTIWRRSRKGTNGFPPAVKLSENMTRWRLSAIREYENRAEAKAKLLVEIGLQA